MAVSEPERQYGPRTPAWWPRGRAADLAVVLICAAAVGGGTLIALSEPDGESRVPMAFGWILIVAACASLYFRRRYPVTVGVITLLAAGLYYPLMAADGPIVLAFAVALYTTAAHGRLAAALTLGAASLAATGLGELRAQDRHVNDSSLFLLAGWLIAAIALGSVARSQRAYLREVEQRAIDAERGREAEARQRAVDERLRIARELHDVLGHNISLINVQAAAALHRLRRDRERVRDREADAERADGQAGGQAGEPAAEPPVLLAEAETALDSIKQASKEALRELRATLGLLRQVDEPAGEPGDGDGRGDRRGDGRAGGLAGQVPVPPSPGVARFGELTGNAEAAGLQVRIETEGEPRPLPADVDLAVYRIVQEALTNVTRHANASTAVVRLHYGEDEMSVRIDDDGPPTAAAGEPAPGNGMLGMSERVRALGGRFSAGPRPGGGFRVSATGLPLSGGAR